MCSLRCTKRRKSRRERGTCEKRDKTAKALEGKKQERTKTTEKREDLKKKRRKGYGGGERERVF